MFLFDVVNGEDYNILTSVPVEFQQMSVPGDRVNISVAILADDVVESWETFKLTLVSSSPSVSATDSATITIIDQSCKYTAIQINVLQMVYKLPSHNIV